MSSAFRNLVCTAIVAFIPGLCSGAGDSAGLGPGSQHATARYNQIPLSFEPNQGQTDPSVQFVSRGRGYSLFLAPGEAYLNLERQPAAPDADPSIDKTSGAGPVDTLTLRLLGANSKATAAGFDRQSGVVNYFVGNDPNRWRSGIPTYGKVNYTAIYPGIDLVFYGNQQQLEYDFVVAPGADPSRIEWQVEGAALSVDRHGDLRLDAAHGPAGFKKPVLYQIDGNRRVAVNGRYVVAGNKVRFALGAYDRSKPLIIDPVLSYLTYFGAAVSQAGPGANTFIGYWNDGNLNYQGLAIDKEGDVYVTGNTNAIDFPVKDAYQSHDAGLKITSGAAAAFVTKINPEGTGLVYSTYLSGGGQSNTYGSSIAVDAEGNAYVAGWTDDQNYPTTPGAFQKICGAFSNLGTRTANCENAGPVNGFVTKLDPAGSKLVYSTFLGANDAYIYWIAVDSEGRAYVTGFDNDYCDPQIPSFECFPTTSNAVQSGYDTSIELSGHSYYSGYPGFAFLTVFTPDGSGLAYSTLLGDNINLTAAGETVADTFGLTNGTSVAVNSAGEFFLTGYTHATKLPVTSSAYQRKPQKSMPDNGVEGYVAKFNPIGSGGSTLLAYLTYLGPAKDPNNVASYTSGITADSEGEAYITGITNSQMFPTTKGSYDPTCGEANFDECGVAFVSKLNASGSELVWSTMFGDANGGADGIGGMGPIQLDAEGDVYIEGSADGYAQFPQVNQIQPTRGNGQVFVAEFNPTGSKLLFSTLIGGLAGGQWAAGLAVDKEHNIYFAGNSNSPGIQPTKGAFEQKFQGGGYNAFVGKISPVAASHIKLTFATTSAKTGEVLTISANVLAPALAPIPTGKVTFDNGSVTLGSAVLNSAGVATFKVLNIKPGKYTFKASYPGDDFNLSSTAEVAKTVKAETTTTLKSSANPSTAGKAVVFTVAVTSPGEAPVGSVTLKSNGSAIGTKTLSKGEISFSITSLAVGTHKIIADYAGNATFLAGTSNTISEVTKAAAQ